jgi:hypothetical protein
MKLVGIYVNCFAFECDLIFNVFYPEISRADIPLRISVDKLYVTECWNTSL